MQRHNVTKEDARKLVQAETGLAFPLTMDIKAYYSASKNLSLLFE